jgi:ribosomal protein L11 methyltransferase
MQKKTLWSVTVAARPEAEEALVELLSSTLGQAASAYTHLETGRTLVTVYLAAKSDWSAQARASVAAGIERIKTSGLDAGDCAVSFKAVRREDWAESWKRHFKPMVFGSKLLVKPSWSRRKLAKGQALVILDPGLSFGTGQHPTTGFCLRQLAALRKAGTRQTFLDIGTGSGILAIAAAKLGYASIEAFDFDPDAVRVARENCQVNRVTRLVQPKRGDVTKLPAKSRKRYDVVCANIIANVLLAERQRIIARVAPGGVLLLAGILTAEFHLLQAAYEKHGLSLIARREENEWTSGAFRVA